MAASGQSHRANWLGEYFGRRDGRRGAPTFVSGLQKRTQEATQVRPSLREKARREAKRSAVVPFPLFWAIFSRGDGARRFGGFCAKKSLLHLVWALGAARELAKARSSGCWKERCEAPPSCALLSFRADFLVRAIFWSNFVFPLPFFLQVSYSSEERQRRAPFRAIRLAAQGAAVFNLRSSLFLLCVPCGGTAAM